MHQLSHYHTCCPALTLHRAKLEAEQLHFLLSFRKVDCGPHPRLVAARMRLKLGAGHHCEQQPRRAAETFRPTLSEQPTVTLLCAHTAFGFDEGGATEMLG